MESGRFDTSAPVNEELNGIRDTTVTIATTNVPNAEQNGIAGSVTGAKGIVAKEVGRGTATEADDLAGIGINYKQRITRDGAIDADASLFSRRIETVCQRQLGREDKAVVNAVVEGRCAAIDRGQRVMAIGAVECPCKLIADRNCRRIGIDWTGRRDRES